jgi:hypothetical protein
MGVHIDMQLRPLGFVTMGPGHNTIVNHPGGGKRCIVELGDITWDGDRLKARKKGSACGDWIDVNGEGVATLDLRFTLETHDGAIVYVHGTGRADFDRFSSGAPLFFVPQFETGDPRYAWINRVQAAAKGVLSSGTIYLAVFELA